MVNVYVPIAHLKNGVTYEQICLITAGKRLIAKNGKPYILITISDISGSIEGYIWDYAKNNHTLVKGKFAHIKFIVKEYKEKLQFNANASEAIPYNDPVINLSDYIVGPNENVIKVYSDEIKTTIDSITDSDYRDIINNAIDPQRINLLEVLKSNAYGCKGPLAYRGGLLIHTYYLLQMVLNIVKGTQGIDLPLDRSLLIVGALLRNLGWISIASPESLQCLPTDSLSLLGSRASSFMLTNHICITTESDLKITIPEKKKLALQNIALASNGPVFPLSLEAKIVYWANQIVDDFVLAEHELKRAYIGKDSWQDSLFIGHLINARTPNT